ncbi:MAG: DUF1329 domain-containing protein [Sterolibacterium sp.]
MKLSIALTIAGAAALSFAGGAGAAPSAEELKQLGSSLTLWGAEKAGNKEGTIPEYTGGVANPPKYNYNTGVPLDPYADDKVSFYIDAKNMDKYLDKLTPSIQTMMKKYPTFRIAVYPTHRSASYPQSVLDDTLKNATMNRCSIKQEGNELDVSKGCRGGFPFPIPKNGYEALWNHNASYTGVGRIQRATGFYVKPSGEYIAVNDLVTYIDSGLYDTNNKVPYRHYLIRSEYYGPTRVTGTVNLYYDTLDNTRKSWGYAPSTRRTRLAPDFAADAPISTAGGALYYDMSNMFSGSMDRFDFKLVGKKEMYIPYNDYKRKLGPAAAKGCTPSDGLFMIGHLNPECMRFELHRVWVIEGTLKSGKRHVLGKRVLHLDEDSWYAGIGDTYDAKGKIFHSQWYALSPDYVKQAPVSNSYNLTHDLNSGNYYYPIVLKAWAVDKTPPDSWFSPDTLSSFMLVEPK